MIKHQSPQAAEIMREAMMKGQIHKFQQDLRIAPPKPATMEQILKLQRHVNKPRGHCYLLQGKQT